MTNANFLFWDWNVYIFSDLSSAALARALAAGGRSRNALLPIRVLGAFLIAVCFIVDDMVQ